MLVRILSVLAGYLVACAVFALVLVAFVFTPAEFASLPDGAGSERLAMAGFQLLSSGIQILMFAAPMAFAGVIMAEWRGIDDWIYYVLVALVIAGVGFLAQYVSELQGAPTIVNNYAFTAFMTGGFVAGFVYWLIAGRHAAARRRAIEAEAAADSASAKSAAGPVA